MPFSYTVLVLAVIGAALIWGATLDSQGRIVVARAGKAGTPQFQPSLKVFGMYCSLPARAYGVLGGKPGPKEVLRYLAKVRRNPEKFVWWKSEKNSEEKADHRVMRSSDGEGRSIRSDALVPCAEWRVGGPRYP
jgi:hypothetical protein